VTPGPTDYQKQSLSPHNGINIKGSQTFSKDSREDIKRYYREYERGLLNRLGPGPGFYETETIYSKIFRSAKPTFPKAVRDLSDVKRGVPGPCDYNTDLGTWKHAHIQEVPKCAIPKAYRKFDIIKYGSTASELIRKGIY
jgi:hypothetical protein